jgi:DNA-directed RNA polymerase subunit beta'
MKDLNDFNSLLIRMASPEEVRSWSHGEVTEPETINYRTLKPEKDGLFCERIFGPTKDYQCYCGKYKRVRYKGIICDKCGVEVTKSRVRRERMGHIDLACPIVHIWYFKGAPSRLSLVLGISPRKLSGVIYFARYVVLEVNKKKKKRSLKQMDMRLQETVESLEEKEEKEIEAAKKEEKEAVEKIKENIKSEEQQELAIKEAEVKRKRQIASIKDNYNSERETAEEVYEKVKEIIEKTEKKTVLTEEEYLKLAEYGVTDFMRAGMGAESILELLENMNMEKTIKELKKKIKETGSKQKRKKARRRLRLIESMHQAEVEPSWIVMKVLPVLPPDLRPMVQLSGGRFASSDLNDLYRRVINRNNRLKHLIDLGAPEIILRNEKRMLQEAVDTLIDASKSHKPQKKKGKKLRSLADMLKGKKGRFRRNLLGKRVDYSGRSVIIVGPELRLNECGLPKDMALEMFKPFVLHGLIAEGLAPNVRSAKQVLEEQPPEVFDILEEVIQDHPVLLNRAPTLHKLGIQAFYPTLIEGDAIKVHPCVCAGYNADFDGDQMAVHLPLTQDAIEESIELMMPEKNLLKPANGSPITVPNKGMALGCYYYTSIDTRFPEPDEESKVYADEQEAILAYQTGKVELRQLIRVRINQEILTTTVGRIYFNEALPEGSDFVNRKVDAGSLKNIVARVFDQVPREEIVRLTDDLKFLGFKGFTDSGLSVGGFDCTVIPKKREIIKEADQKAAEIENNFNMGLITEEEKKRLSNDLWMDTTDELAEKTWNAMAEANAVKIIINSGGTRASKDQIKQLSAMRGLVVDPLGNIVELPTKSNFREGLSVFEYVNSARGSRKGLTDSAIKTADAGYLTRRLVDVSQEVLIREDDCGTTEGIWIHKQADRKKTMFERIQGRVLAADVEDKDGKAVMKKGELIRKEDLNKIQQAKVDKVKVRSPLTCKTKFGVCQQCYGLDLSSKRIVDLGTPIGVIAAQSIGEPGTQLTMRTKHSAGIVGLDVTQGLPRVEELFEARTPKVLSPISEISGKVAVEETNQGYKITVSSEDKDVEQEYTVPLTSSLKVEDGDVIPAGHQLASGGLELEKILEVKGLRQAQKYLVDQVQAVYERQGIPINDKHFEVIIRKMSDKVRIKKSGDTTFLPREYVSKIRFDNENKKVLEEGDEAATAEVELLGITKAALYTESWLSAASFQHTSNVLTEASLMGKEDDLKGLKENVIIGRLIPVTPERAQINN